MAASALLNFISFKIDATFNFGINGRKRYRASFHLPTSFLNMSIWQYFKKWLCAFIERIIACCSFL